MSRRKRLTRPLLTTAILLTILTTFLTACYKTEIVLSEYCAFRDINPVPVVTDTQFEWLRQDENKPIKDFLKIEAQAEMDYCAKEVD